MACHWCVGPYLYPGLKGSPYNPIPSEWPSPHLVVDACCHVFNTQGRNLRVYRSSLKKIGPRISRDEIAGQQACEMVEDLRAMCVYILYRNCMWLPSPGDVPQQYTMTVIGQYFNRRKYWASRAHIRAVNLLGTDQEFQTLFRMVLAQLAENGFHALRNAG